MSRFTTHVKDKLLKHYFKGVKFEHATSDALKATLLSNDPTTSGTMTSEISGLTLQGITWSAASSTGGRHNTVDITFPTTGLSGTVNYVGIVDTSDNLYAYGDSNPNNHSIVAGTDLVISGNASAGGLAVGFDTNTLSASEIEPGEMAFPDAIAQEAIGFIFDPTATVPTQPTGQLYLALFSGSAGSYTELSVTNYSRRQINFSDPKQGVLSTTPANSSRMVDNTGAVTFSNLAAGGSSTSVTRWGVYTASTSGTLLAENRFTNAKTVEAGGSLTFNVGTIQIDLD